MKFGVLKYFGCLAVIPFGAFTATSCSRVATPSVVFGSENTISWVPGVTTNLVVNTKKYYAEKFNLSVEVKDEHNVPVANKDAYVMFQTEGEELESIDEWLSQHVILDNNFVCPNIVVVSSPSNEEKKFYVIFRFFSDDGRIDETKTLTVVNSNTKIIFDSQIYNPFGENRTDPESYHKRVSVDDEWFDSFFGDKPRGGVETFEHFYLNREEVGTEEFYEKQKEINNMLAADFYYHINYAADQSKFRYFDDPARATIMKSLKFDSFDEENSHLKYVYDTITGEFECFDFKMVLNGKFSAFPLAVESHMKFGDYDNYFTNPEKSTSKYRVNGLANFFEDEIKYMELDGKTRGSGKTGFTLHPVDEYSVYTYQTSITSSNKAAGTIINALLPARNRNERAYWWNTNNVFGATESMKFYGLNFFSYTFSDFDVNENEETLLPESKRLAKNKIDLDKQTPIFLKRTPGKSEDYFEKYFFNQWEWDSETFNGKTEAEKNALLEEYSVYKYSNWVDWENGGNPHIKETVNAFYGIGEQTDVPNAKVGIEVWDGTKYKTEYVEFWQLSTVANDALIQDCQGWGYSGDGYMPFSSWRQDTDEYYEGEEPTSKLENGSPVGTVPPQFIIKLDTSFYSEAQNPLKYLRIPNSSIKWIQEE